MDKLKIAILGAGRMGSALTRTFVAAQLPTTVWNRTREKLTPLAEAGAQVAPSIEEAISAADLVVVIVNDYDTSERLLRTASVERALRGRALVQFTSGSPRLARSAGKWAHDRQIAYLDGAIMATPDQIGARDTTVLYAGEQERYDQLLPALQLLGGNTQYVGADPGHASALDSALLAYLWAGSFGVLVGAAICEAEGLSLALYRSYVEAVTPLVSGMAPDLIERMRTRRFASDAETQASLEVHHIAFRHLLELSHELGLDPALHAGWAAVFRRAAEAGRGPDEFASLAQFLRPATQFLAPSS